MQLLLQGHQGHQGMKIPSDAAVGASAGGHSHTMPPPSTARLRQATADMSTARSNMPGNAGGPQRSRYLHEMILWLAVRASMQRTDLQQLLTGLC